ncbi:PH domain-containing protein [Actinoplanes sp. N902-109]|uniref:PH domain-containing protein n=1 Tax=Actinoplanes sp. (strain N902-109) TaxID=649831 RepID=UPI000329582D|nr:PH domain-containing protein [Actinoplanes sp. N902-109]AGL20501.1 hypothetical protein L083_6991 [Actinoplanes sp. N902-109]
MSSKPFRVRRSGALVLAAFIAFVGTVPLAGGTWKLAWILLIPLAVLIWALRAGTDVTPAGLKVRALFGSTGVAWDDIAELAPDGRKRISARLTDGRVVPLTAVTTDNLPAVLAAGGQQVDSPARPEEADGR